MNLLLRGQGDKGGGIKEELTRGRQTQTPQTPLQIEMRARAQIVFDDSVESAAEY